jgi:hypothetical protein
VTDTGSCSLFAVGSFISSAAAQVVIPHGGYDSDFEKSFMKRPNPQRLEARRVVRAVTDCSTSGKQEEDANYTGAQSRVSPTPPDQRTSADGFGSEPKKGRHTREKRRRPLSSTRAGLGKCPCPLWRIRIPTSECFKDHRATL